MPLMCIASTTVVSRPEPGLQLRLQALLSKSLFNCHSPFLFFAFENLITLSFVFNTPISVLEPFTYCAFA